MSKFNVPEMSCGHCTSAIENEILNINPNTKVTFDLSERTVEVAGNSDTATILTAIKQAGYDATVT